MSKENVEIVRRSYAAYDGGGLDALPSSGTQTSSGERSRATSMTLALFVDLTGCASTTGSGRRTFDAVRPEIEELIEAGDQVVAVLRVTAGSPQGGVRAHPPDRTSSRGGRSLSGSI